MVKIRGGITAPKGYRAAAIHSGIKRKKELDLALLVSESPAVAAGLFTTNRFQAAPVTLTKAYLKRPRHKAIIVNSGNANCLRGKEGLVAASLMAKITSFLTRAKVDEVLVCSTGIIGKRLPIETISKALPRLVASLKGSYSSKIAQAIMTTDTFPKEIAVSLKISGRQVRIGAIAKGAGMIEPNLATMLCLITTDAQIARPLLKKALKEAVDSSFNSITVDGGMSTNDTVLMLANGSSGLKIGSRGPAYKRFVSALGHVCLELAKMIVRDGEGATKFIEIDVKGAATNQEAERIALAIANSNLFKAMCFGQDPNFGRIAAACGASSKRMDPYRVDIYLNGKKAVKDGVAIEGRLPRGIFHKKDINVSVDLKQGKAQARIFTSDLSPEYVKINAEYS